MVAAPEQLIRPGAVLGLGWGAGADEARARFERIEERRHAETLTLTPAEPVALAGLWWRAELLFILERLGAVTLRLVGPLAQLDGAALLAAADGWVDAHLLRRDEGLWEAQSEETTLTIDLLEGRLAFADAEAP